MTRPTLPPDWSPPRIGTRHEPARLCPHHLVAVVLMLAGACASICLLIWAGKHVSF